MVDFRKQGQAASRGSEIIYPVCLSLMHSDYVFFLLQYLKKNIFSYLFEKHI